MTSLLQHMLPLGKSLLFSLMYIPYVIGALSGAGGQAGRRGLVRRLLAGAQRIQAVDP